MSSIAEAFMKKVRDQNRQRQARYLSNPQNKKKAQLRQKERYNQLKEMKNPKTAEMDHSALLNPNKEVENSNFQFNKAHRECKRQRCSFQKPSHRRFHVCVRTLFAHIY